LKALDDATSGKPRAARDANCRNRPRPFDRRARALDRPKESGVPKALKRTAAATEQFKIVPTMPSSALSPLFLGQEECVAVDDELAPPVCRNIPRYLMTFEASDSIVRRQMI
jgi:hypothetical protein